MGYDGLDLDTLTIGLAFLVIYGYCFHIFSMSGVLWNVGAILIFVFV